MHAHRRARAWGAAAAAATLTLALGAGSASAAGSHGPLTCLDGFVWRQATPKDHVCVTPAVRAQTARDNALAQTRRGVTAGTFGPDLCVAGYVWREAVPRDHVCVAPATWQQVHDDNLTAGARRNALRVKIGTYLPAEDASTRHYWVHADGINVGVARVALFWPGRRARRCHGRCARDRAPRRPAASSSSRPGSRSAAPGPTRSSACATRTRGAGHRRAGSRPAAPACSDAPQVLGPIARGGPRRARVAWSAMHAIRLHAFGPPESLRYEHVEDPRPGPGQARIAVAAAGVHLIDTALRAGRAMGPLALPELPTIPGREVAGVVDAVGPEVDEAWLGRRVVAHLGPAGGGYAELAVREADALHALPRASRTTPRWR